MERQSFHAMGTDVELFVEAPSNLDTRIALNLVHGSFQRLEAKLSRFRGDSELSRLNTEGAIEASDELLAVVGLALEARERTSGVFDPTIHNALVAAGYDRSFEQICGREAADRTAADAGGGVRIEGRRIELEPGVRLDLGGIAKGYAVDRGVEQLAELGPCLVNAGGDLAVSGTPAAGVWPVAVEVVEGSLTLGIERGALATSGRDRRRWRVGREERHHLIDPATGRPAKTDLLRITVAAETCVEAEVLAKVLFLAGEEAAARKANELGVGAILVTEDGRVRKAGGLA